MNVPRNFIPRNFEALFLAVTVVCSFAAFAASELPRQAAASVALNQVAPQLASPAARHSAQAAPMPVVIVKAKRLSAAENPALA